MTRNSWEMLQAFLLSFVNTYVTTPLVHTRMPLCVPHGVANCDGRKRTSGVPNSWPRARLPTAARWAELPGAAGPEGSAGSCDWRRRCTAADVRLAPTSLYFLAKCASLTTTKRNSGRKIADIQPSRKRKQATGILRSLTLAARHSLAVSKKKNLTVDRANTFLAGLRYAAGNGKSADLVRSIPILLCLWHGSCSTISLR